MWIPVLQVGHCFGVTSPYSLIHPHTPKCLRSTDASFSRERFEWEMYVWKYFTSLPSLSDVCSFKGNSSLIVSAFLLLKMERASTLLSPHHEMSREDSGVCLVVSLVMLNALGASASCCIKSFPLLVKLTKSSHLRRERNQHLGKKKNLVLMLSWQQELNILMLKWYTWVGTWTGWPSAGPQPWPPPQTTSHTVCRSA